MTESTDPDAIQPRAADLWSTVVGRRSVRAFSTRPVPLHLIERAIEAAGWAPSPHGSQPWRFVIVASQERRYALAEAMAVTWRDQLSLDGQDASEVERRLGRSMERLQRAPVLILICLYLADTQEYPDPVRQAAEWTMAVQSLGAATQNLLLLLHQQGLDAGWMCAPLFCPEVVRASLGLTDDHHPHALIPVGIAAADPKRRPRRAVSDLISAWL
ncbi:MAG: nitroreductase family protein [Chloroflexota bacterium]|nr:nitroreductase family protein [Chloroflexota bacterium]